MVKALQRYRGEAWRLPSVGDDGTSRSRDEEGGKYSIHVWGITSAGDGGGWTWG